MGSMVVRGVGLFLMSEVPLYLPTTLPTPLFHVDSSSASPLPIGEAEAHFSATFSPVSSFCGTSNRSENCAQSCGSSKMAQAKRSHENGSSQATLPSAPPFRSRTPVTFASERRGNIYKGAKGLSLKANARV